MEAREDRQGEICGAKEGNENMARGKIKGQKGRRGRAIEENKRRIGGMEVYKQEEGKVARKRK